jgi:predicted  nucleic acid-binding Zn-ribbon protein
MREANSRIAELAGRPSPDALDDVCAAHEAARAEVSRLQETNRKLASELSSTVNELRDKSAQARRTVITALGR